MRMLFEGPLPRVTIDDDIAIPARLHPPHDVALLSLHLARREGAARLALAARNIDQIARRDALFKLSLDLWQPRFAHRVPQRIAQQRPLIDHRRTLHAALARIRHRRLGNLPRTLRLKLHAPTPRGLGHHSLWLISMLGGESLMLLPHLLDGLRLLRVTGSMRRDLRRPSPAQSLFLQPLHDLLTPRTRCLQILFRITLDLRLTMLAALHFIA